jgi:biofilm PGA synthesis lipoprotein PgaB
MRAVFRALLGLVLLAAAPLAAVTPAPPPAGGTQFAAIAFHDVVDRRDQLTPDAVTAQSLVDFFDWLKADGWTPVSLSAIEAAGRGGPPLPPKAILLSFDDGYRSFHDRVYPLLLAYGYPAMLAVVSSWLDVPEGGKVDYGGTPMPRAAFVSWDQIRRMQASGLVEIASHSHDMHTVVRSTPQGNSGPAARSWAVDPATGRRESDAEHRARIHADLALAHARIQAETGRAPLAIVWPFGRFSGPALEEATRAGFTMAFTLEPEMGDATRPLTMHRYYPTGDPSLGVIAYNLRSPPRRAETVRLACLDIAPLAGVDAAEQDRRLGEMIESVRKLGASAVALAVAPEGSAAAWLPGTRLPMTDDIFGRAARQLGLRGGVQVFARIPAGLPETQAELATAAARVAPIDGLLLDVPAPPALFEAARRIDPRLQLLTLAGDPQPADRRIVETSPPAAAAGLLDPAVSGRTLFSVPPAPPAAARSFVLRAQALGVTGFALCPFDPAQAASLAPAFSAARFPWRP